MECRLPSSSVHGIYQARILEWVAISFSRGSSWPRIWTWVSCLAGRLFTTEPLGKPTIKKVKEEHFLILVMSITFIFKIFLKNNFKFIFSIFGCPGSLLLCGPLLLWRVDLLSSCSPWSSHCGGFSCFRAWATGLAGFSAYGLWTQYLVVSWL